MKPCTYCQGHGAKRKPHHRACLSCTRIKARWRHARKTQPSLDATNLQALFKLPPEPDTPSQRRLTVANHNLRVRSITSKNKARREAYADARDLAPFIGDKQK